MPFSTEIQDAEVLELGSGTHALDALKIRLAGQIAPRLWRASLDKVARAMDSGSDIQEAVRLHESSMPSQMRCLLQEAEGLRDPAGLLVEAIGVLNESQRGWRELILRSSYPVILLAFAIGVGVAFSYCMLYMIDLGWMEDFGLAGMEPLKANLVDQHHAIVGLGLAMLWIGLVLLTVYFAGPAWSWVAVMGGMIFVGKPLRWLSLSELLFRYQLFIRQGMSTTEATRAVARSFDQSAQAVVSRAIADRVQEGTSIGQAIGMSMLTDGMCRPPLFMLDRRGADLGAAIEETADLLLRMAETRCRTLSNIMPIFVLGIVGTVLWASISAYLTAMTPLITIISSLA